MHDREGGLVMETTADDAGAALASNSNTQQQQPSSAPVEMSNLQSGTDAEQSQSLPEQSQEQQRREEEPGTTAGASSSPTQQSSDPPRNQSASTPSPRLTRMQSEALGPATDSPIAPPLPISDRGPTLSITLMLTSGARHPYKIDEKYLKNRKVDIGKEGETGFDPRDISCYKLKELIWTDWRQEWEPRPASPSSIRLIILGRLLEDKAALKGMMSLHWLFGR